MLTITETAAAKLSHYMRENGQGKAVRIKLRSGGWATGPSLALVLDEPGETDFRLEKDGVLYLVDRMLLARCGSITVDFEKEEDWSGFALVSENPLLGGCWFTSLSSDMLLVSVDFGPEGSISAASPCFHDTFRPFVTVLAGNA